MNRALVLVAALGACSGSSEDRAEPAAPVRLETPTDTRPTTPPDCPGLVAHIDRLTASETETIRRTRPVDVAPAAEADLIKGRTALKDVLPRLCASDGYPGAYTACVAGARTADDARACHRLLTASQTRHLEAELAVALAGAPSTTGIPECDRYVAAVRKLGSCDQMPAASRDAMQQAIDQIVDAWKQAASTPEGRTAAAQSCKSAVEAITQAASSLGCSL